MITGIVENDGGALGWGLLGWGLLFESVVRQRLSAGSKNSGGLQAGVAVKAGVGV